MGMWTANMDMEMEEGPGNGPELTIIILLLQVRHYAQRRQWTGFGAKFRAHNYTIAN